MHKVAIHAVIETKCHDLCTKMFPPGLLNMLVCFFRQFVKILCSFAQMWKMSLARVTYLNQQSFVKIETLRGRTPTEICSLLR